MVPIKKVSLIDITDLYHPYQDPGDNFDLIMPYALPEIDLKAVILDVTDSYRQPVAFHRGPEYADESGPRDAGIIPVTQLNYLFDKNVPFAVSPFSQMKSLQDKMLDVPAFQQQGIELILNILRNSSRKVEITVFSSVKALAVAYNREPDLFYAKVDRIHICAGASSHEFLEWNVALDPNAIICLLRSHLPIALYPCASKDGPFALHPYNSFWMLKDLSFVKNMDRKLKRYIWYAFERVCRNDFLRAMEEDVPEEKMFDIYRRTHNVWETAVWMELSGRKLVKRADGSYGIIPEDQMDNMDIVLKNELLPCKIDVDDKGLFKFELTGETTNFSIYYRDNPVKNEIALREALANIYSSFRL